MTSRAGRALVAAGLIVFTFGSAAVPVSADSSMSGACTDSTGVTVVVDFQPHLGGAIRVGCAEQPVATGLEALTKAGFKVTQASGTTGVFICRIDDQPANDPCLGASPAFSYWSYWYSLGDDGGWRYSSSGAGGRTPPPGSLEGWSFAYSPAGGEAPAPRISPSSSAIGSPTSEPTSTPVAGAPTSVPDQSGSSGAARPSDATTGANGDSTHADPAVAPSDPTHAVGSSASPGGTTALTSSTATVAAGVTTTSTTSQPDVQVESAQKSRSASTGGSKSSGSAALGSIIALCAIVAAGAGAGIISRRRAQAE